MNKTESLNICYIGGGSRNWAWVLMKDLASERELSGTIRLYDIDHEAAQANERIGNRLMETHNPGRWHFLAVPNLAEALEGSDFVFVSILPLDFAEMAVDVHLPERCGLWQSVGDTVGPGGLIRALRTIPMFQDIARAIRSHAPDAWVFNYTNPMSICTRTLYREFPLIKAFGCCHEVFGTQKLLARAIEKAGLAPKGSIRREAIQTNVVGINHFTWIDRASWQGLDLFPVWKHFAELYAETGYDEGGDDNWLHSYFSSMERVKIDLFRRYGLIAAAGDRHLAEFCPPSWYLGSPDQVSEWKFTLTPVSFRIRQREELKEKSRAYRDGKAEMKLADSGEEGIALMKALLGLGNIVTNVNLPNRGQMPLFPADAVVETNALFSRDSVVPVVTEGEPDALRSLTLVHVGNQEGIVDAAFERDLEKAFLVFLNDLQVRTIHPVKARSLFDDMVKKTLPDYFGY
jgi:alpha-galactosidase